MPQQDIETFLTTARWLMVDGLIPAEQLNETSFMSPWQVKAKAEINIEEDLYKKDTNTYLSNISGVFEDTVNLEENVVLNYLEYKEESSEDRVATVKKRRGPDKEWFEKETFSDKTSFNESDFKKDLDNAMSKKSFYDTARGKLDFYVCKYTKRKAYKPCPVLIRVTFSQHNLKIVVFNNEEEHCHELNPNYNTPTNFHFTSEQEEIIKDCANDLKSVYILRKIKAKNAHTNGSFPSLSQIGTKKRNMRKQKNKTLSYKEYHENV